MNLVDAGKLLNSFGITPMNWEQVLSEFQKKLTQKKWKEFQKLHDVFIRYGSEENLLRYYGFIFRNDLESLLVCYRFNRIKSVLCEISSIIKPGIQILDVGAGAGYLGKIIIDQFGPQSYIVQDICPEVRDYLAREKFSVLPHPPPQDQFEKFDVILCVDSLGELNSDDNDEIYKALNSKDMDASEMLEEHYGFAHKLETWKSYLKMNGKILIWEPFPYKEVWNSLLSSLEKQGWQATLCGLVSEMPYLKLNPLNSKL